MNFLIDTGLIEYLNIKNILIYLFGINLICLFLMFIDKKKAKYGKWRIPENILITTAILGGSIGGIIGMYTFRHKNKKIKFFLGYPAILIIEVTIIAYFLIKY